MFILASNFSTLNIIKLVFSCLKQIDTQRANQKQNKSRRMFDVTLKSAVPKKTSRLCRKNTSLSMHYLSFKEGQ